MSAYLAFVPLTLLECRRTVLGRSKALMALDHRPVFRQERLYAEAWWGQQQVRMTQYIGLLGSVCLRSAPEHRCEDWVTSLHLLQQERG